MRLKTRPQHPPRWVAGFVAGLCGWLALLTLASPCLAQQSLSQTVGTGWTSTHSPLGLLVTVVMPALALAAMVALIVMNRRLRQEMRKRIEIEAALRRSESHFREFVEDTDNLLIRVDAKGRLRYANKVAAKSFGLSQEACVGQPLYDFIHPDDVPATKQALREWIAAKRVKATLDNRLVGTDGQVRHLTWNANLHYDEKGWVTHINSIVQDNTAHVLYENTLKESERKYRTLFEATNEGVCVQELVYDDESKPRDFRVLDVNPRCEALLGISRKSAVGALGSRLFASGRGLPILFDVFVRVAQQGEPAQMDVFNEHLNKYFSMSIFSPKTGQFATMFQDITDRKLNEDALRRALAFNRAILSHAPVGVAVFEVDTGRCVLSNQPFTALTGVVCDKNSTVDFRGLPAWKEHPLLLEALEQSLEAGKSRQVDIRSTSQTASLNYTFTRIDVSGKAHLLAIVVDITERLHMEEICIQTEKLESVGGLAAGLAHEINNPLGGILQSVQVVRRRLEPDMLANKAAAAKAGCNMDAIIQYMEVREIPELLHNIDDAGRRAAAIVATLLDFSRKSSSPPGAQDVHVPLEKALSVCLNDYDLKEKFNFPGITIVRDYDEHLPLAPMNAGEMEQVFVNLLRNAAQAMCEAKTSDPRLTLRTRREAGCVRVEIIDNGPGIDKAHKRKIFEPFFTTRQPGEGRGLGLSVTYYIVTANHGGQMEVESRPGQGSKFIIRLPLTLQQAG
ncbi:hypothetical protein JCM15519_01580 [Fundidesulfovibrio butyratiphilus]